MGMVEFLMQLMVDIKNEKLENKVKLENKPEPIKNKPEPIKNEKQANIFKIL